MRLYCEGETCVLCEWSLLTAPLSVPAARFPGRPEHLSARHGCFVIHTQNSSEDVPTPSRPAPNNNALRI